MPPLLGKPTAPALEGDARCSLLRSALLRTKAPGEERCKERRKKPEQEQSQSRAGAEPERSRAIQGVGESRGWVSIAEHEHQQVLKGVFMADYTVEHFSVREEIKQTKQDYAL